jgi:hypothetical protein
MPTKRKKKAVLGFELWDKQSGNALGGYDTEAAALTAAAEIIARRRPEHAASLILLRVGPRGGLTQVAKGADLVARATSATTREIAVPAL